MINEPIDIGKIMKEAHEVISDGQEEISEEKKILFDKATSQSSIKIPKSLALKSGLNEDSKFQVVFNPNEEETIEKMKKSRLVIYLEVKNDEREKTT